MAAGAQLPTQAQTEILAAVQKLFEGWNSHDMRLYAAQFSPDADFVNVLGMHWQGRSTIEETHVELHRKIFRNSSLKMLNCALRPLAPRVVLAHVGWEMTGHETPPYAPFTPMRQGLMTAVFVEQDGRWLIAALHNTDIASVTLPGVNP